MASCTSSSPRARTTLPSTTPSPKQHSSQRSLPTLPYAVERAAGAVIGDTGYVLGGLVAGDRSITGILSIAMATGTATRIGTLPIAAHDAAAVPYGSDVLLFGGSGAAGNLVQRFDPRTGTVTTIGHLPRTLSDLAAVSIGDTTYVVGGYDGTGARAEILETTNGRTFTVVATLPQGLRYAAVAVAGSKLLVAGGQTRTATASRTVYEVDPAAGSVRELAQLSVAVAHAVMLVRSATAYLIGGRDSAGRPTARVWQISLGTGAVSPSSPLAIPIADPTLLIGSTRTILAGGATGHASSGGETNEEILFT